MLAEILAKKTLLILIKKKKLLSKNLEWQL